VTGWNARWLATFGRFTVVGACAVLGLILWLIFLTAPALAQQPTFEISIHPLADYAQTGQIFTYTVIITNTGVESLPNIVVKLPIPAGSAFLDTKYTNSNWLTGSNAPGSSNDVVWFSQQPVPPQQTDTFQLIVNVTAPGGQTLMVDDYQIIALDSPDGTALATGPALHTPVFAAPPTPAPTSPAPTAIPPATASPTTANADPALVDKSPSPAEEISAKQPTVRLYTLLALALTVLIIMLALVAIIFRLMRPR
jgi:uncharacterized repeat protein (TIGR01451 family)